MSNCVFCRIVNNEIPSEKLYEDNEIVAFYDVAPQAPVHILFVPKIHITSMAEVTAEHTALMGRILVKIAFVAAELGLESYRIVTNSGENAGQTVFHLHFHVLGGRTEQRAF